MQSRTATVFLGATALAAVPAAQVAAIGEWAHQTYLKASPFAVAGAGFGTSVALSGDTLVMGAPSPGQAGGEVYVFTWTGSSWSKQAQLAKPSGGVFGEDVAISGDTLVVGDRSADLVAVNGGAAYVYVRTGTTWSQQAVLTASNPDYQDWFGGDVAISGDVIVVGASNEDSGATGVNGDQGNKATDAGAAYVFARIGTTWVQQAYLKASNTGSDDSFGTAVAVSGETIAVGAYLEDSAASGVDGDGSDDSLSSSGAVYLFERSGTTWSQTAYVKASPPGLFDSFGVDVALSGGTLAVGARGEDSGGVEGSGAVYVFGHDGVQWQQQALLKASNAGQHDSVGSRVALATGLIVAGAFSEDSSGQGPSDNSAYQAGAAYVFQEIEGAWQETAYLKAPNAEAGDFFGHSVAAAGGLAVVGAPSEDSSACCVNGDPSDNGAENSGAVYTFLPPEPCPPAVSIPVVASVEPSTGPVADQTIGSVELVADAAGLVATFELDPAFAHLDDCTDFRWVSVETGYVASGVPLPVDPLLGPLPAITPSAADGPEPFTHPAQDWSAGFAGSTTIRQERVLSRFSFSPAGPPDVVRELETYLVAHDVAEGVLGDQELCVLAGFAWSVGGETGPCLTDVLEPDATVVAQALATGQQGCPGHAGCPGFPGWAATSACMLGPCELISGDPPGLFLVLGGVQSIALDASAKSADAPYFLLGTISGTAPGLALGPYQLGLNPDPYFLLTATTPDPPLADSFGVLDGDGRATATFTLPAGLSPSLSGIFVHHAALVFDGGLALRLVTGEAPLLLL